MEQQPSKEQMQRMVAVLNEFDRYRKLSEQEKEKILLAIMSKPFLDLRVDWAFKHVFQNLAILKLLLNDFLPEEIDSVEKLPNEVDKLRPDDKNIIMDVLCKTPDGREFIVEMQRKKKKSFKNRMFYYGASMIHAQLTPKQSYIKLKPVYVICFMDFTLDHTADQLVYRYAMREQHTGELYGKQLSIILCELPRLRTTTFTGDSPVEDWFFILKNLSNFAETPEAIGDRYAAVLEAAKTSYLADDQWIKYLRNMISEEEKMDIGEAYYEDGFRDGMKQGEEKGREEGKEEGRNENRLDIARQMVKMGLNPDIIAQATGLTEAQIKALL